MTQPRDPIFFAEQKNQPLPQSAPSPATQPHEKWCKKFENLLSSVTSSKIIVSLWNKHPEWHAYYFGIKTIDGIK